MSKALLIIMGLLALAGGFFTKYYITTVKSNTAQYLPAFNLPDLDGKPHSLAELQGKITVINFWATWCPPCRREIPDLVGLQARYASRGLRVIGIAIDDKEAVEAYLKNVVINYPVLVGGNEAIELGEQMGNNVGAIPFTVIAGADGRIIFSQLGEMDKEKITRAIMPFIKN